MTLPAFTTITNLQKRMSSTGVSLRIDDDSSAINNVIADAGVEAFGYVGNMYAAIDLASSAWFEKKVTDIAAYYLCMRRNNKAPISVEKQYDKTIEDLEKAQKGSFRIPDCPMNKSFAPVLSAPRLKVTPFPHIVIEDGRSTGNPEGYPRASDVTDWFDFGSGI
jgi:phage gp36-like protein